MPKKRQGRKDDRDTSQEMQKVRVEDADGEFEGDDEALDDDDNLFDSGVTDTSEFPAEEPEEFDEEFDDEDLSSESIAMDSAALVDDPVRGERALLTNRPSRMRTLASEISLVVRIGHVAWSPSPRRR